MLCRRREIRRRGAEIGQRAAMLRTVRTAMQCASAVYKTQGGMQSVRFACRVCADAERAADVRVCADAERAADVLHQRVHYQVAQTLACSRVPSWARQTRTNSKASAIFLPCSTHTVSLQHQNKTKRPLRHGDALIAGEVFGRRVLGNVADNGDDFCVIRSTTTLRALLQVICHNKVRIHTL